LHGRSLEFFGPNHGHKQIGEQQQRDNGDNDCFHLILEPFAKADVKRTHDKEQNDDSGKDEIAHRFSVGLSQKRE
jgi:hypothetical protein